MSESELADRVPIQTEAPGNDGEIRIPGNAQTVPRPSAPRFEAPAALEWGNRAGRKAYVPDLGYLISEDNHGPSEHTGSERLVWINGERFILENPHPVESDVNWADKRTFGHVYGPEVRFPELDIYPGPELKETVTLLPWGHHYRRDLRVQAVSEGKGQGLPRKFCLFLLFGAGPPREGSRRAGRA
jgi:hypothetical protein